MNMARKLVLVSQRADVIEGYNEKRDALDQKWAALLWEAGCAALPMPNHAGTLEELLNTIPVDGIVLSGGGNPVEYGGASPERDHTDRRLISYAAESGIPLLGVCRGMQSIVLFYGGTLEKAPGHVAVRHMVGIDGGRAVNSYHEYRARTVPGVLGVLARSEDGGIEAIMHGALPIMGIMWHPEREDPFSQEDIDLVKGIMGV